MPSIFIQLWILQIQSSFVEKEDSKECGYYRAGEIATHFYVVQLEETLNCNDQYSQAFLGPVNLFHPFLFELI